MPDFLITSRRIRRGEFIAEPGRALFLKVPSNRTPAPDHSIARKSWLDEVMHAGHTGQDDHSGEDCGDIAIFVHGYNTSPADVARRHRKLSRGLRRAGFGGALVSYDWPSDDRAINYLEDRVDAKLTALALVRDGIALLAATHKRGCRHNVHVIAHSMGAYVVREAFDDADDRPAIAASNWNISQLCLVGADISSRSMAADDARSRSLYRHATRVTNYFNPYDSVLKLSNVKRAGVAPRAGRRGLPDEIPERAIDVNCGARHKGQHGDDPGHSWYFDDTAFIADLAATLAGDTDGRVTAARRRDAGGDIHLI